MQLAEAMLQVKHEVERDESAFDCLLIRVGRWAYRPFFPVYLAELAHVALSEAENGLAQGPPQAHQHAPAERRSRHEAV